MTDSVKSEELFRKAFITSPDSININRLSDGMYISINKGFAKITGYSEEEIIGKTSLELNIWDSHADRDKLVTGLKSEGLVENMETRFRMKDGSVRDGMMSATIIEINGIPHILSITRDITEKKAVENALRESEIRYRELVDMAPDGILVGNHDGVITGANRKMVEFTGRSSPELIGSSISTLFSKEELNKSPLRYDLLKQGENVTNLRILSRPDGTILPVEMHTKMMPDGSYQSIMHDISGNLKSDKDLKESEEKIQSIFRAAPVGIGLIINRVFFEINDMFCTMTGYSRNELIGQNALMIYPSEVEYNYVGEVKYKQITESGTGTLDTKIKCKDGSIIDILISSTPLDINDLSKGFTFTALDISEKKRKEIELRKLSQAVEQNPASIVITDTKGLIEYVNPKLCEITGYIKDELIGKNPSVFSSREKSSKEYKILWDTIKSGNEWKGEFHNRKKNGDLYWESALLSPIKNDKDEITHFLGIKEDITLRKTLEAATLDSEERYKDLFNNNPVPSYIFDESTLGFIEVNVATEEKYGYSREELTSMTLKDIRAQEDIPDLMNSVASLGKDVFHSINMRHRKKDGTVFPVEIISHSLPEKNGRSTRLVMATDITERLRADEQMKLAREKAEASDRLKTTFLNNISHEVRTPLNGILGFAEIINLPGLSEDDKKESLSMLYESSERLLSTITNYMDISLLTSGSLTVNNKEFNVTDNLRNIYDKYASGCSSRNLEFDFNIPDINDHILINSDPEIIGKIICHFLENAIKFTDAGGISLGYNIDDSEITYYVKDTGTGIGEESLNLIFEKFSKEEKGPLRITEGSGLGLAIAKGMSEMIGGKIIAESEPGKGSSFYLSVKLKPDQVVIGSIKSHLSQKDSNGEYVILIADDDEINFFYINSIISREINARILHARNGQEAIDIFKANSKIDLVLMDIKMPEMNGLDATRHIKQIRGDIPVIAITAYAMAGDEERVLESGCDSYLSKPISKEKLLKKMSEFVKI